MLSPLFIFGSLAAVCFLKARKNRQTIDGVGKVVFYKAMSEAQDAGISFGRGRSFEDLSDTKKRHLERIGKENGYSQTKRSIESGRSFAEAFYNYLNGKYKAIAGIGYLTTTKWYDIKDNNGEIILRFQHIEKPSTQDMLSEGIEVARTLSDPMAYGYYNTLIYLYNKGKFRWDDVTITNAAGETITTSHGLRSELFGQRGGSAMQTRELLKQQRQGKSVETRKEEKKYYRAILSKDGLTPEKFTESLTGEWTRQFGYDNEFPYNEIRDGVLDALKDYAGKNWIIEELSSLAIDEAKVMDRQNQEAEDWARAEREQENEIFEEAFRSRYMQD